jgi:hypothetical protein
MAKIEITKTEVLWLGKGVGYEENEYKKKGFSSETSRKRCHAWDCMV